MDPEKHLQQQQQQQQQQQPQQPQAQPTVVPQQPQQPQQPQPPRPQQPPQQPRPQQPQQPQQQQPQLGLPPQHLQQAQAQDESLLTDPMSSEFMNHFPTLPDGTADTSAEEGSVVKRKAGRRKIPIEFIDDKSRRQITFSKRKAGLMKKAYELTTLTGTQALLLVASETGHVYTFATPKLQPFVTIPEGKSLIQACLNAPDPQPIGPNATGQPQAPRPQGPYETKNEEAYEQPTPAGYQQEQAPAHWGAPSLS